MWSHSPSRLDLIKTQYISHGKPKLAVAESEFKEGADH